MLLSMGLQRVRHDLATEQQQPRLPGSYILGPLCRHLLLLPSLTSSRHTGLSLNWLFPLPQPGMLFPQISVRLTIHIYSNI